MKNLCSMLKKLSRRDSRSSHKYVPVIEEPKIRRGYIAMYVGEESRDFTRYEVPVKCLSNPALLQLIEQEMGQEVLDRKIDGPIKIVNSTEVFDEVLKRAKKKKFSINYK